MPEQARMVQAADACANLLAVLATDAEIHSGNNPIRDRIDLAGERRIDVWGWFHRKSVERLTRSEVIDEIELVAAFTDHYDEQTVATAEEKIPTSWVNDALRYIETKIFDVLDNNDNRLLDDALYPWSVRYEPEGQPFDQEHLLKTGQVLSGVRVVYREKVSG
jgi:hypothetical protein